MAVAILIGAVFFGVYATAAVFLTKKVWARTERYRDWARVLLSVLVLTVFFAPAVMGAGHGAGIGPAWLALVDPNSNRFVIRGAWISIAVTWGLFFVIGTIIRGIYKHRHK